MCMHTVSLHVYTYMTYHLQIFRAENISFLENFAVFNFLGLMTFALFACMVKSLCVLNFHRSH